MIRGHSVAKFARQRFIACSKRCLSFEGDSALEATRENDVKSSLRKVIDKASGKNLVMTGSVQVKAFHSISCFPRCSMTKRTSLFDGDVSVEDGYIVIFLLQCSRKDMHLILTLLTNNFY